MQLLGLTVNYWLCFACLKAICEQAKLSSSDTHGHEEVAWHGVTWDHAHQLEAFIGLISQHTQLFCRDGDQLLTILQDRQFAI